MGKLHCVLAMVGVAAGFASATIAQNAPARPEYPEGVPVPRNFTDAEKAWAATQPPRAAPRGPGTTPTGPLSCPGEYAPADGLLLAWEGGTTLNQIQAIMIRHITTTGNARVYLVFDTTSERDGQMNIATSILRAQNPDLTKVIPVVRTTDTIWIRDYGPRYVYEGDVRIISDHTYNGFQFRPNDDAQPVGFASFMRHARYTLPLIHGGGNYHLDSIGRGFATRLIANENPSLGTTAAAREAAVINLWQQYQGVNTLLFDPFPTNVDATQHIDMWMQVVSDNTVIIGEWPAPTGGLQPSTQRTITENAAITMANLGYNVFRVPSRSLSGVHYTYTNMVIANNLVLVPSYVNATMQPLNAPALATIQAAMPGKTLVQVNSDALASLAGVMHCIVMHVPVNKNGVNPGVYVRTQNSFQSVAPGSLLDVRWSSDDDNLVVNADIDLSLDDGATWSNLRSATADDGVESITVPDRFTRYARIRVTARDAQNNLGSDLGDARFTIVGTCPVDFDGNGTPDINDVFAFLNAFFAASLQCDYDGNGLDTTDIFNFLNAFFAGC